MARLFEHFKQSVVPRMMEEFRYANRLQVPRLHKVVLSMGLGEAARDKAILDETLEEIAVISGQRPLITRARKSIAGFKVRAGMTVGCKVTLRGARMYEFFDRLVNVAIPRIRDFRGIEPVFDGRGNMNFGLAEVIVFPEVNLDKVKRSQGLNVALATSARTDEEARAMLGYMGMPFKRYEGQRSLPTRGEKSP